MKIPSRFKLVNRTYRVTKMPKEIAEDLKKHGDCDAESKVIRLAHTEHRDLLEHTFCHELVHGLLWSSTRPDLSEDEEFVDSLGAALHQFMQTKSGEYK